MSEPVDRPPLLASSRLLAATLLGLSVTACAPSDGDNEPPESEAVPTEAVSTEAAPTDAAPSDVDGAAEQPVRSGPIRPEEVLAPVAVPDELRPELDLPKTDNLTWQAIQPPPMDLSFPRKGHALHAIGDDRALVFGGIGIVPPCDFGPFGDGAVLDTTTRTWAPLPPLPVTRPRRVGFASAWTGEELIVWGGAAHGGCVPDHTQADGAAWDPDTDTWRELAPAPLADRQAMAFGWTGEELVVWGGFGVPLYEDDDPGGTDPSGGGPFESTDHADGAAYDPASDTWRTLPPAPPELAGGGVEGLVDDDRLWVIGPERMAVLDLSTETWSEVAARPDGIALGDVVAAPDGAGLLAVDSPQPDRNTDDPVLREQVSRLVRLTLDGVEVIEGPWDGRDDVQVLRTTNLTTWRGQTAVLGMEGQRRPDDCGYVAERYRSPAFRDQLLAPDPGEPGVPANETFLRLEPAQQRAIEQDPGQPVPEGMVSDGDDGLLSRCTGWPVVPLGVVGDVDGELRQLPASPWRGRPGAEVVRVGPGLLVVGGRDDLQEPDAPYEPDADDPSRTSWLLTPDP